MLHIFLSLGMLLLTIESNECYQNAYEYILKNTEVSQVINNTFRHSLKRREIRNLSFCIDAFAYDLSVNDFPDIGEPPQEIQKIDYGLVPEELVRLSKCNCENVTYNLIASIINEDYMTLEISSKKFNPLGGAAFGPSVKFLFHFDGNCNVQNVWHQSYMNG